MTLVVVEITSSALTTSQESVGDADIESSRLTTGGKVAVGIMIPLAVILMVAIGIIIFVVYRRRKLAAEGQEVEMDNSK